MRDRILIGLYLLVAMLPVGAKLAHIPDRPLAGVVTAPREPKLRFWAVMREKYQQRATAYFEHSIGLKGYSMFLDGTLLARVFREGKVGGGVVLGEDNVLFAFDDVGGVNRLPPVLGDPAGVDQVVARIAELQRRMLATGRLAVPVLVPSKTTIYRDKLPDRWQRDAKPADELYPRFRAALARHGVQYVDAAEIMAKHERSQMWGPYGRHWTSYGACLALQEVVRKYSGSRSAPPVAYECTLTYRDEFPHHDDFDLWRLLNAALPVARHEVPAVDHGALAQPTNKPKLMLIGDSFVWQMAYDATESGAFGGVHINYYNQTFYSNPPTAAVPVKPSTDSWREIMVPNDIYIFDILETYMPLTTEVFDQMLLEVDAMPQRPREVD